MDGNSLDALLTPELQGQVIEEPASNPAPGSTEPVEPGQGVDTPPASTEPVVGQGDQATNPDPEMVPKSQYDELRKAFTQKAMRLSQLEKQSVAAPAQAAEITPTPQAVQQPNSLQEYIALAVQASVAEIVAPIQQQQQDLRIQTKVTELADDKEFEDVAPAFLEILNENPELIDSDRGIDLAYLAAKASYLEKAVLAKSQAATAASRQVTAQKVANTDTAPIVKPAQVNPVDEEATAIRQSILDFGKRSSIF